MSTDTSPTPRRWLYVMPSRTAALDALQEVIVSQRTQFANSPRILESLDKLASSIATEAQALGWWAGYRHGQRIAIERHAHIWSADLKRGRAWSAAERARRMVLDAQREKARAIYAGFAARHPKAKRSTLRQMTVDTLSQQGIEVSAATVAVWCPHPTSTPKGRRKRPTI